MIYYIDTIEQVKTGLKLVAESIDTGLTNSEQNQQLQYNDRKSMHRSYSLLFFYLSGLFASVCSLGLNINPSATLLVFDVFSVV